jgi:hypothetical protein
MLTPDLQIAHSTKEIDMSSNPSNIKKQLLPRFCPRIEILLVTAALSALWIPGASAACAAAQALPSGVAPLLQLSSPLNDHASDDVSPESGGGKSGSPSMTGLWRTIFAGTDGAVLMFGFNTWHADGSEWALDGQAPAVGNVCPGVWEKVGPRTYRTVHPAFNYDTSNTHVVGIFIERLKVTISRDGNRYQGTFTWDNYDFAGNLLPGSVAGTITATRIIVGSDVPFPFPQ